MAVLGSGKWAVYNTHRKEFVCGREAGTGRILVTDNPGEVQYFKSKKDAETAMLWARCGKNYKAVHVKLVVEPDEHEEDDDGT